MLRLLEETAAQEGAARLRLISVRDEAVPFYLKRGYSFEDEDTQVWMTKALPSPAGDLGNIS